MTLFYLIAIGAVAGILAGLMGISGGVIITPALVLLLGFSQKAAQGTTLWMLLPPIGIFAALTYYKHGNADLRAAAILAGGFVIGSIVGALLSNHINEHWLMRGFAVFTMLIAIRLFLKA